MKGTLLIAVLSVRGSYNQNIEYEVQDGEIPDTLQWFLSDTSCFRIRTFALDHDVRIQRPQNMDISRKQWCLDNDDKQYSEILASRYIIELDDWLNRGVVVERLQTEGLALNCNVEPGAFAFWTPDSERYWTQSPPE